MPKLDVCPYCKAPVMKQKKYTKTKHDVCGQLLPPIKSFAALVTIIVSVVVALAAVGFAVYLFVIGPMITEKNFEAALKAKDWETAYDLSDGDDDRTTRFESAIIKEANEIFDDYVDDELDYDKAESKLKKIKSYHSEAKEKLDLLHDYKATKECFDAANQAKAAGDYKSAMNSYSQISCSLPNEFKKAMSEIESCVSYLNYDPDAQSWYENYLLTSVYAAEDEALKKSADADSQDLFVYVRDKYEEILNAQVVATAAPATQDAYRAALTLVLNYTNGRDDYKNLGNTLMGTVSGILKTWWDTDISQHIEADNPVLVYDALRINEQYFIYLDEYTPRFANALSVVESQLYDMFTNNIVALGGATNDGYQYYTQVSTSLSAYPEVVSNLTAIFNGYK